MRFEANWLLKKTQKHLLRTSKCARHHLKRIKQIRYAHELTFNESFFHSGDLLEILSLERGGKCAFESIEEDDPLYPIKYEYSLGMVFP